MKVPKALNQYFPPKECSVAVLDDLDRIKVYLESRISICRAQGPIGDTGYFQLVRCSPQHKGKKRLIIVATVENVEKARRIYLASAEQYRSPSLELLRTLVVVAVDASTDFETLAIYWFAHVRTPLPPPIELCPVSSRT